MQSVRWRTTGQVENRHFLEHGMLGTHPWLIRSRLLVRVNALCTASCLVTAVVGKAGHQQLDDNDVSHEAHLDALTTS